MKETDIVHIQQYVTVIKDHPQASVKGKSKEKRLGEDHGWDGERSWVWPGEGRGGG